MTAEASRRPVERWAFVLAFLLVASIPPENGVTIPGVGSLSKLLGVAALGVTVLSTVDRGWLRVRAPAAWLIVAAVYVLWNVASYLWSRAPGATFGEIVTLVQLLGMAWVLWQVTDIRSRLDALFGAFVLGNYVTIAAVVGRYVSEGADVGFRDLGAFNANGFAIVASLAVPMAWRLATSANHAWVRLAAGAYPAAAFVAVVIAASRGGLLVFLTVTLVLVTGSVRLGLGRRLLLFATVAVVAWGGFNAITQVLPRWEANVTRLMGTDEELRTGDLTGRVDIWVAGFRTFEEAPLLGIGAGAFRHVVGARMGDEAPAHNAFVSVATCTGLIGLSLFVAMLVLAFLSGASDAEGRSYLLVLAAALTVAMMPTNSEADKFVWFIVAALGCARPIVWAPGASARRRGVHRAAGAGSGD